VTACRAAWYHTYVMPTRSTWLSMRSPVLGLLCVVAASCMSVAPRFWRDRNRGIVVQGPMLDSENELSELSKLSVALCQAVILLPGATAGNKRGGQEYCGLIYQRNGERAYLASYPSTIGPQLEMPDGRKGCTPPDAVEDSKASSVSIYADYHSHPSITRFSPEDLQARRQRYYFRMMFNPRCEVYLYDFQERTVSELRDGEFVFVKRINDDERGE
jgi:hypothetical protein